MGLRSPMASHHWRIIGSLTGSRPTSGAPKGFPTYGAKACSSARSGTAKSPAAGAGVGGGAAVGRGRLNLEHVPEGRSALPCRPQMEDVKPFTDPVCGMKVRADGPHQHAHGGTTYRLCSARCLEKFRAEPARYLTPSAPPATKPPAPQASTAGSWT